MAMMERIWQSGFSGAAELGLALLLSLLFGSLSGWRWARFVRSGLTRLGLLFWRGLQKSSAVASSRWGPMLFTTGYALFCGLIVGLVPGWVNLGAGAFWASTSRIILLTLTLSLGQWLRSGLSIQSALKGENVDSARRRLHRLTGQNAEKMTLQGLSRGACEGLGEEMLYGVLLPVFLWAFGQGFRISIMPLLLCWAFMALHALWGEGACSGGAKHLPAAGQSMRALGYMPAHLGAVFVAGAAFLTGKNGKGAVLTALQQAERRTDKNGGLILAVLAGALGLRLGGGVYCEELWRPDGELGFDVNKPSHKSVGGAMALLSIALLAFGILAAFLPRWMGFAAVLSIAGKWALRLRLMRGAP